MQNTTWRILAVGAGLLAGLIQPALAGDFDVPCWRGQPATTLQDWGFATDADPASPEQASSPGSPTADIQLGFLSSGWLAADPTLGTRTGIWDLGGGGQIECSIPEIAGTTDGYRYVVVQMVGYKDSAIYTSLADVNVPGATLVSSTETPLETNPFGGTWFVKKTVWRLGSAPGSETVLVQAGLFGGLVDQVLVETLTIDYPCPGNIAGVADANQCSKANVTWTLPSQDGCVYPSVVSSYASGSTFSVGATPVTAQVTDVYGYVRACNWTVTITDAQLPVVTCPGNIVAYKETGECGAHVSFTPTATDNCTVSSITSDPASGSVFPLGVTTVTCVARDASGNESAPCSFTVQVLDMSGEVGAAPCWRGLPSSTYQQWAFSTGADPAWPELWTNAAGAASADVELGALAGGWLDNGSLFGCRQGLWDLGANGSVTLSVPEVAGSVDGYRYVVVQATGYEDMFAYELPVVSLAGASLVSSNRTQVEAGLIGAWTVEKTVWRLGSAPASEAVVLQAGAFGGLVDQVLVETLTIDYPCPVNISGVADSGVCGKANVTWTLPAQDSCVYPSVVSSYASGSTFPVGVTPVTAQVTDGYGYVRACNWTVTITDAQLPVVTCPGNIVAYKETGECGAHVSFTPTATDNCTVSSITSDPASGSVFPLGVTTVTCTARDASGNESAPCSFTVQVLDMSGDVGAAPCWRGLPLSTYQQWAFSTGADPAWPELWTNAAGAASADVELGALAGGWLDNGSLFGCRQGLWDLGANGSVTLSVPEVAGSVDGYRYVVVQATGYEDMFAYELPVVSLAGASLVSSNRTQVEAGLIGAWTVEKTVWRLGSAPGSETVLVQAGAFGGLVDQVLVETLTIDYPCPGNIAGVADANQCNKANITWTLPAQDTCVYPSVVSSYASGATFPVGVTPVTAQVADVYGYVRTCNWTVTIIDDQLPVVTCPGNIVAYKETGECGAHVTFTPTATDNCTVSSITSVPASGSVFPLGVTTVTCTARDASGNESAPCSFTVQVLDMSGDVGAAPCWRGLPLSTYQQWAFSTGADPAWPELWTNAAGAASADVELGALAGGWLDNGSLFGCRQGLWDLGANGSVTLSVPEVAGSVDGYRYVVVQATGYEDMFAYELPVVSLAGASLVSSNRTQVEAGLIGAWTVEKTVWRLGSAPGSETVLVQAGAFGGLVDQVLVETLTIDYPCPGDVTGVADTGVCGKANVVFSLPAVDGCILTGVDYTPANGSTFPVGATPVSAVVHDALGGTRTCGFNVVITDTQAPEITSVSVAEAQAGLGTVNVKDCAGRAVQGTVLIDVNTTDNCGLPASPVVTLVNGASTQNAVFVNESPAGTYHYTWAITAATAPGTWSATVTATDAPGLFATSTFFVCVDTTQIAGQIQLEGFVGTQRAVTFVASGGASTHTWTVPLTFSGGIADYALQGIPAGTSGLSAKTAWSLRRKLAVALDGNGQATANFTGASMLLGGDLTGNNQVSTGDYTILSAHWQITNPVADINGSGAVSTLDYNILSVNWHKTGDPE